MKNKRTRICYAHNFEAVEGAYWFGASACVRVCVRPLRFAYGQERLEMKGKSPYFFRQTFHC